MTRPMTPPMTPQRTRHHPRLTVWSACLPALLSTVLLTWGSAHADSAERLGGLLPDAQTARGVLLDSPQVQEGRARRDALENRANMIETGPAEFSIHINRQRRRASEGPAPVNQGEHSISLERPLRLWHKAATDQSIAQRTRELALIGVADTIHETSRDLLRQLFDLQRAETVALAARESARLSADLQRNIAGRLSKGDVALQDLRLVQAEAGRALTTAQLAQGQADRTWAQVLTRYPGLIRPEKAMQAPTPDTLTLEELEAISTLFLERNHELNVLRADLARQQASAQRSEQDRLPDPTVGVFSSRERAGAEQIMGVTLSVPLPGQYRQSQAGAARSDAVAAYQRLQWMERRLLAEFRDRWQQASQRQTTLGTLQAASQLQNEAADKAMKAYALGEGSLADALYQRRLATEQDKDLRLHRLEYAALWAEIELDLHRLWDFD